MASCTITIHSSNNSNTSLPRSPPVLCGCSALILEDCGGVSQAVLGSEGTASAGPCAALANCSSRARPPLIALTTVSIALDPLSWTWVSMSLARASTMLIDEHGRVSATKKSLKRAFQFRRTIQASLTRAAQVAALAVPSVGTEHRVSLAARPLATLAPGSGPLGGPAERSTRASNPVGGSACPRALAAAPLSESL